MSIKSHFFLEMVISVQKHFGTIWKYDEVCILVMIQYHVDRILWNKKFQTHNQDFFKAGDFSLNYGTSMNILQHEKERPHGEKNIRFFRLETLKKFHFKWEILPIDDPPPSIYSPELVMPRCQHLLLEQSHAQI